MCCYHWLAPSSCHWCDLDPFDPLKPSGTFLQKNTLHFLSYTGLARSASLSSLFKSLARAVWLSGENTRCSEFPPSAVELTLFDHQVESGTTVGESFSLFLPSTKRNIERSSWCSPSSLYSLLLVSLLLHSVYRN